MWREVEKILPCVKCGTPSKRHSVKTKTIYTETGRTELEASKHYCPRCRVHFTNPASEKHAPLRRKISWGLLFKALQLSSDMTLENACEEIRKQTGYALSPTTLHDWVVEQGKLRKRYEFVRSGFNRTVEEEERR